MKQSCNSQTKHRLGYGLRLTSAIFLLYGTVGLLIPGLLFLALSGNGDAEMKSIGGVLTAFGAIFAVCSTLAMTGAITGRTKKWGNYICIAVNAVFCPCLFGIFGVVGGVRGNKAIDNPGLEANSKPGYGFGLRLSFGIILFLPAVAFCSLISVDPSYVLIFISISLVCLVFAILQCIAAVKGKTKLWANTFSIVTGCLFIWVYFLGILAIVGGVKGRKIVAATDEKYIAKRQAKERKRIERQEREMAESGGSYFSGGAIANFFISLLANFVSVISLGFAYPAMVCWKLRWKAKHTYIKGRRLRFDGRALQFFGKYMLWLFLSVITFGLYYIFCMKVALIKWQTKHTHFEDTVINGENGPESRFNGRAIQLFGVNTLARLVTFITLSFGQYWAHCYKERWFCKHKTIDGLPLKFDGMAMQYFGKRIVWWILTVITLGIYGFWLRNRSEKWTASHTKIDEEKLAETVGQ